MTKSAHAASKVPEWFAQAIAEGEQDRGMFDKRHEGRPTAYWPAKLVLDVPTHAKTLSVKIANLAGDGIGLLVPEALALEQVCTLTPTGVTEAGDPFEPIRIRVVHCTQAAQGYKVGCVLLPTG